MEHEDEERRPRTQGRQKRGQWRGAHFFPDLRSERIARRFLREAGIVKPNRVGPVVWAWTALAVVAFVVGTAASLR